MKLQTTFFSELCKIGLIGLCTCYACRNRGGQRALRANAAWQEAHRSRSAEAAEPGRPRPCHDLQAGHRAVRRPGAARRPGTHASQRTRGMLLPSIAHHGISCSLIASETIDLCLPLLQVLLLDEPTSALDPISTQNIEDTIMRLNKTREDTIMRLNKTRGLTTVIVSHSVKQIRMDSERRNFISMDIYRKSYIRSNPTMSELENFSSPKIGSEDCRFAPGRFDNVLRVRVYVHNR
jgi:hypothetical protein